MQVSGIVSKRALKESTVYSIHHDIPVTLHTPVAYGQWSVSDHSGDKQYGKPLGTVKQMLARY